MSGLNRPALWNASLHHCSVKWVTTNCGRSPNKAEPGANDTMNSRYNGKITSSTDPRIHSGKATFSGVSSGSRLVRRNPRGAVAETLTVSPAPGPPRTAGTGR